MSDLKVFCFKCKTENARTGSITRRDECEKCSEDLHVCLNCRFYDEGSYNECKESSADLVQDKERANFCDYFSPSGPPGDIDKKEDLLSAAEALFSKK